MSLSADFKTMVHDMSDAYDARKGELAGLKHQLHQMLSEFKKEKKEELKKLEEERRNEISSIKQKVSELKHDIHDSLKDFRKTTLAEIQKGAEERKEEVSHMLKTFRKDVLDSYKYEFEDMASAWHELVASMKSKRAGKAAQTCYTKPGTGKAKHEKKSPHGKKSGKSAHH